MKNDFPRNVYRIRKTLFDKLNSFGIKYTSERKLFKNLTVFDFESICVQKETFRDTWIRKHVKYLSAILQTLWKNQFSSTTMIPTTSLHRLLEHWKVWRRKVKHKLNFYSNDIKTTSKIKLGSILEKLTQRHNRREHARFDMNQDDCDNEICASTQFLRIQKIKSLIFKNLWNVNAMFYLCLASTMQNTI